MYKRRFPYPLPVVAILLMATAVTLPAQSVVSENPGPSVNPANQAWVDLDATSSRRQGSGPGGSSETPGSAAASYVSKAGQLRQFQADHPDAPQVKEARRLEALNLMWAAQEGDHGNESRWKSLVAELRGDTALPSKDRYRMVIVADFLQVQRRPGLDAAGRIVAYEQVARDLIRDFPEEPGGYESMLAVARNSPAERGGPLALELLGTYADETVKTEARRLVGRYGLPGTNIADLLDSATTQNSLNPDLPTVVYAWATENSRSIAQGIWLKGQTDRVNLIGLCLDTDLTVARKAGRKLSDRQIYDEQGKGGAMAQSLYLADAGWVYHIGREGTVLNVRVQDHLSVVEKF